MLQARLHVPFVHVAVLPAMVGQAFGQAPQWFGSLVRSAHVLLQLVWLAGQPFEQEYTPPSPAELQRGVLPEHMVVHVPQLDGWERSVAQPAPPSAQSPQLGWHWYEQTPPEHEAPVPLTCGSAVQS
jgi:hypothetical protein